MATLSSTDRAVNSVVQATKSASKSCEDGLIAEARKAAGGGEMKADLSACAPAAILKAAEEKLGVADKK